jgi:hypothetical protein
MRRTGGAVGLFDGDCCLARAASVAELIPLFHAVLDGAIVQRLQSTSAVHASGPHSMAKQQSFLARVIGVSPLLFADLLNRAASTCPDEYALIDDEGLVYPYPRALLLRDKNGNQTPTAAADLGADTARSAIEPR